MLHEISFCDVLFVSSRVKVFSLITHRMMCITPTYRSLSFIESNSLKNNVNYRQLRATMAPRVNYYDVHCFCSTISKYIDPRYSYIIAAVRYSVVVFFFFNVFIISIRIYARFVYKRIIKNIFCEQINFWHYFPKYIIYNIKYIKYIIMQGIPRKNTYLDTS